MLGRILQKIIDNKYSQYKHYNKFGFVMLKDESLMVLRENGNGVSLPFKKILSAIEGYKTNLDLYDQGPDALRLTGISHINSPIHSLLHLLDKDCYA